MSVDPPAAAQHQRFSRTAKIKYISARMTAASSMPEVWRKPSTSAETASFIGYDSLIAPFRTNLVELKVERLAQRGQLLGFDSLMNEQMLWTRKATERRCSPGLFNGP